MSSNYQLLKSEKNKINGENRIVNFYLNLLHSFSYFTDNEIGTRVIVSKSYTPHRLLYFFKNKIKLDDSESLLKEYNNIKKSLYKYQGQNIWDWLNLVYDYGILIRTAEKCSMFVNDKNNDIYCEITNSNSQILNIYFQLQNYKVKISFEKTKIPQVPKFTKNILSDYINGNTNTELDENLFFITIEIVRTFGKQMCNVFKFISNETPRFNDVTDKFVFSKFVSDASQLMIKYLDNILEKSIKELPYVYANWLEALTEGFIVYYNDIDKVITEIESMQNDKRIW